MQLGKPTICAANGHVLAGALGLALSCDLIVAREGATFGTPEINVGVFPFMIMALIYRNVPRKKTNELLLLGERISAEEALAAGIVNRVVPAGDFDAAVDDWAVKLAGKSPVLMKLGKDAMYRQLDMPLRGRARLPALAALDRLHDRGHPGGREGLLREARAQLDGALSGGRLADRHALPDLRPLRGRARGRRAARPARGRGARARAALHRQLRGGARDALRGRPARFARLPARGGRPDRRRAGGRRRPGHVRGRLRDRAHDPAGRDPQPARRTAPLAGRARRLQLARHHRQRLPRRDVPGRRLRHLGRRPR